MLHSLAVLPRSPAAFSLVLLAACGVASPASELSVPAGRLQQYLRIDTSNPPGGEERGAAFLRDLLHHEGIATRLFVSPRGRTSLFARLAAEEPTAGPLVLMHHIDVVPAGPGWTAEPFAGVLGDGALWGRGAVDDKSLGIAHVEALLELKRRQAVLDRDVVFLAVADEETGGGDGTGWLLERHPELVAGATAVLGEGGSNRAFDGRLHWWGIEVAQKRPLWLRVTAHGRGGHGSTLNLHTAPHRLLRGLQKLIDRPLEFRVSEEARRYLEAVAPFEPPGFRRLVAELDEIVAEPEPARRMLPGLPNYFLDTLQVNVLAAGEKINVAPEEASALIDLRLLPDTDADRLLGEIEGLLGDGLDVEVLLRSPRVEPSSVDTPFFACLEGFLRARAPVVPTFIPGITDSRYFRERGIPAYGFSPFVLGREDLGGIHGPDERIGLAAFDAGVETMVELVLRCATADGSDDG